VGHDEEAVDVAEREELREEVSVSDTGGGNEQEQEETA
jgi:hypothetical protein